MSNPGPSTRQRTKHPLLQTGPDALPINQLPWKREVYAFYVKTRSERTTPSGKKRTKREIAKAVKDAIVDIWDRASLITWIPVDDGEASQMGDTSAKTEREMSNVISENRITQNVERLAITGRTS